MIAPEDATVTATMIRKAALDAAQSIHAADLVIVVGFEFAPETGDDKVGRVGVVRVRMYRDGSRPRCCGSSVVVLPRGPTCCRC